MESNFDEGNFVKARSFLMVFSTMLLVLWYFEAEMSTLSLLGNSIKFTANTHNLWLVLAVANIYFFCRYIQHLPKDWRKPGKDLESIFDSTLCRVTQILYWRRLRVAALDELKKDYEVSGITDFKIKPSGSRYYSRDPRSGHFIFPQAEMKVDFSLPSTWISSNGSRCSSEGFGYVVEPAKVVVFYARLSSFIKGVVIAPWFTEHLFPIFYAACAIGVGFWSWHTVDVSTSVASPVTASMQANPQAIRCMSESIQAKHSVLSVACVPRIDVASPTLPLVLKAAPSTSG
jgi:hypothetical protein